MVLKLGDSVIVKPSITDPDLGTPIDGWQGRVSEIDGDNICIDWDSITLRIMPDELIVECEKNDWRWDQMYLFESEVTRTKARDTKADVTEAIRDISYNCVLVDKTAYA